MAILRHSSISSCVDDSDDAPTSLSNPMANFLLNTKQTNHTNYYENIDVNDVNEEECGVNEPHVDCLDVFNTSQVIMFMIVSDLIK